MKSVAIHTRALRPPQDDLFAVMGDVPQLENKTIVCVASKVVAIHQGRCVSITSVSDKNELIQREANYVIPRQESPGNHTTLTLTNGSIIGSAGIDRSNGGGYYVLWPLEPHKMAWEIRQFFVERDKISDCGVIIIDSHSSPLRRGATGFSIGFAGFKPLKSYVGVTDIFGNVMKAEVENVVDGLAASASVVMGEGGEQTPVVLITELQSIVFDDADYSNDVIVPIEKDNYYPLTKKFLDFPAKN